MCSRSEYASSRTALNAVRVLLLTHSTVVKKFCGKPRAVSVQLDTIGQKMRDGGVVGDAMTEQLLGGPVRAIACSTWLGVAIGMLAI